jgi:hypothetical protein
MASLTRLPSPRLSVTNFSGVIRAGPPLLRGKLPPDREQEYETKEIEPVVPIARPGIGTGHHRHRIELLVRPHRHGADDILWQFASPEQKGADRLLAPAKLNRVARHTNLISLSLKGSAIPTKARS